MQFKHNARFLAEKQSRSSRPALLFFYLSDALIEALELEKDSRTLVL